MWYKNVAGRFFRLVTKHACDGRTDRQSGRQNYDSQVRASIAASRGNKTIIHMMQLCLAISSCNTGITFLEFRLSQGNVATLIRRGDYVASDFRFVQTKCSTATDEEPGTRFRIRAFAFLEYR